MFSVTEQHPSSSKEPRQLVATFDEVYRAHAARVWRTLRALGVRPADLDDACQEVFVVVLRRLPDFDGRHPISTWLYAISLRVASDARKRAHHRRELLSSTMPEQHTENTPEHDSERRRAADVLAGILASLDDEKRAVFVLFELSELPMNEVADAVGVPLKTAYSRLYAARAHVEQAIARINAKDGRP